MRLAKVSDAKVGGLSLLAAIIFLSGHSFVWAFQVGGIEIGGLPTVPGLPVHETITTDALQTSNFSLELASKQRARFSDAAIDELRIRVRETDTDFRKGSPKVHFDDDSFVEGNTFLMGLRSAIVRNALKETNAGASQARWLLGTALHAVQDFYAHSSWVESQRPGIAPLGRLEFLSANFFKSPEDIGSTCTAIFGPINIRNVEAQLISGYDGGLLDAGHNVDWTTTIQFPSGPQQKCIHGGVTGVGLNKDFAGRLGHANAKAAAIKATEQFVADIAGDLAGKDGAICYLLGNPCNPILRVTPRVVQLGGGATILWDTNNGDETMCTLTGGGPANVNLIANSSGDKETGSFVRTNITGAIRYTLSCPGFPPIRATVEVVGGGFES